ncbi:MAG: hypothetical protein LBF86_04565 [Helicobacteraceae bacterium]|nr:hypothetical protein [Helicobacteraceae bacterium]
MDLKLKANGVIEWQKSLGGSANDYANSIQQTKDGGYIIAGVNSFADGAVTENQGDSNYWIVKLKTPPPSFLREAIGRFTARNRKGRRDSIFLPIVVMDTRLARV